MTEHREAAPSIPTTLETPAIVAVPEGPPPAVTLMFAFAAKRMTAEKILICTHGSCETMANASVVCTDEICTLTQNVMRGISESIGIHAKFIHNLDENKPHTNAPNQEQEQQPQERDIAEVADKPQTNREHADDFSIDIYTILSSQPERLPNRSITVNSTAFEDINPEPNELAFIGPKMETTLLQSTMLWRFLSLSCSAFSTIEA